MHVVVHWTKQQQNDEFVSVLPASVILWQYNHVSWYNHSYIRVVVLWPNDNKTYVFFTCAKPLTKLLCFHTSHQTTNTKYNSQLPWFENPLPILQWIQKTFQWRRIEKIQIVDLDKEKSRGISYVFIYSDTDILDAFQFTIYVGTFPQCFLSRSSSFCPVRTNSQSLCKSSRGYDVCFCYLLSMLKKIICDLQSELHDFHFLYFYTSTKTHITTTLARRTTSALSQSATTCDCCCG